MRKIMFGDVDGLPRNGELRDPGTSPGDLIFAFHGGGSTAENILSHAIPFRDDCYVLALNGLKNPPDAPNNPGDQFWVAPGDNPASVYFPVLAPNDMTDLHFIAAAIVWIKANLPSVKRIWWLGMSQGSKMGWCVYAFNRDPAFPFDAVTGFFLGSYGMPQSFNWEGMAKSPRPVALWYGTADNFSQENGIDAAYPASVQALMAEAGGTSFTSWTNLGDCCGCPVRRHDAIGGGPVRVYQRIGGHHGFEPTVPGCTCYEEEMGARAFYETVGWGAP